jgi:predicted component of type VI protein secretion system
MKLSLIVAQGVHSGKVIPVAGNEFLIGRDPHCQLRPASPAVSKQHCSITVRDGKVFVKDIGSTNGTFVNEEQVAAEREVVDNDKLKVGPLEFVLRIEVTAATTKSDPAMAPLPPVESAKPVATAPAPKPAVAPAPKPAAAPKPAPAPKPVVAEEPDADQLAALLLAEDGGTSSPDISVPDGTTVMEIPAMGTEETKEEKAAPKPDPNNADTSGIAAQILSKYMRRPRT